MEIKGKNIKKIVMIFIVIILMFSSYSFASDISSDAKGFLEAGGSTPAGSNSDAAKTAIGEISGILTGLGIVIAVIVAAVLGIKFILSPVDEKADIKQAIIPYVCGCIVIFGALGIWRLVIGLLNSAM